MVFTVRSLTRDVWCVVCDVCCAVYDVCYVEFAVYCVSYGVCVVWWLHGVVCVSAGGV